MTRSCGSCAMWREQGGECRAPVPDTASLPASVSYALIGAKRRMGSHEGGLCPRWEETLGEERISR